MFLKHAVPLQVATLVLLIAWPAKPKKGSGELTVLPTPDFLDVALELSYFQHRLEPIISKHFSSSLTLWTKSNICEYGWNLPSVPFKF
jgi:hypothetical protein